MNTEVTFRSDRFRPYLPEDCQVNPGTYGAELAYWLSRALAAEGVVTSYPSYKDWGWFLTYITEAGEECWLCCGNAGETTESWRCLLEPKGRGLFRSRKAAVENARPLLAALERVLQAEPGIHEVRWSEAS